MQNGQGQADAREVWRSIRARHPGFRAAVLADAGSPPATEASVTSFDRAWTRRSKCSA